MNIQVHADHHIEGNKELLPQAEIAVEEALARFSERLTTVLVHFNDVNSSSKSGDNDKRCALETRPAGRDPITVTEQAPSAMQALDGAIDKMVRTLDRTFERLNDPRANIPQTETEIPLTEDET